MSKVTHNNHTWVKRYSISWFSICQRLLNYNNEDIGPAHIIFPEISFPNYISIATYCSFPLVWTFSSFKVKIRELCSKFKCGVLSLKLPDSASSDLLY